MSRVVRSLFIAGLFVSFSLALALRVAAAPNTSGIWIGGLKSEDRRIVAISLHRTRSKNQLDVWLRTGEMKSFELFEREAKNEPATEFRSLDGDNVLTLTLENNDELRGRGSLASANLEGTIRLVRIGNDSQAEALYERLWKDDFFGPESYQFLAIRAAKRGELPHALLWLRRGRAAQRPLSDALLFSAELESVRRDPRFRVLYIDPVAAHPELSQATNSIRVDRNIRIPMRDKVRLIADIYRPDLHGRFPVILIRTPYGRGADIPPGGVDHFSARGYAVVIQSVRGTGGSEGDFLPWLNERKDGYDSIDWVSRQKWSNGRVGMMGLSYLGQAQWAAAVEAHPALKCIIPEVSGTDHMLDVPYDHGILRMDLEWIFNMLPRPKGQFAHPKLNDEALASLPLSTLDKLYTGQTLLVWQRILDLDNASKWSSANFLADLGKVRIPVLNISGWWDGEATSTTTNYSAMRALGREDQWLIYGPWAHVWNQSTKFRDVEYGPTALIDFKSLSLRWFDHWLKQKKVNLQSIPKVQVFVTGANEWRSLLDWPDPTARPFNLYLAGRETSCTQKLLTLSPSDACADPHGYEYDPATVNPLAKEMISETSTAMQLDGTAKDMLIYESDPFETAITLAAPATLDLWFSTSAHDADFFVVVFDRDSSGTARALAGPGKMRMRYINGWDAPHALKPNQIYHGKIDLRPFAHRFEKNHRLGILIRSEWFPFYERNLNTGEAIKNATRMEVGNIRLFHDASHPSSLRFWKL